MTHILIADSSVTRASDFARTVEQAGFTCTIVPDGHEMIDILRGPQRPVSIVVLDADLDGSKGLDVLRAHPGEFADLRVIIVAAEASLAKAIEAMRAGAHDFLARPVSPARLVTAIKSAIADTPPATAAASTPKPVPARPRTDHRQVTDYMGFIGQSPPMQNIYKQIESVARSGATVFISGESGTGKEVCAEATHRAGPRAAKPFVAVNCGAIPPDLLESELFGHVKGAFTGAHADRIGAVASADGGTLFLDEICELEFRLQVKLLRFLQTGSVQRVGAAQPDPVDVRIICATNRHAEAEVAAGRFREDLYYRLAVIPIEMPPLRVRGPDIVRLANVFLVRFGVEENKQFAPLDAGSAAAISAYDWPGNVRHLQNVMRRAAVMFDGPEAPIQLILPRRDNPPRDTPRRQTGATENTDLAGMTLDQIEHLAIEGAVSRCRGSLPAAARALGVSPSTLYRKRERLAA